MAEQPCRTETIKTRRNSWLRSSARMIGFPVVRGGQNQQGRALGFIPEACKTFIGDKFVSFHAGMDNQSLPRIVIAVDDDIMANRKQIIPAVQKRNEGVAFA